MDNPDALVKTKQKYAMALRAAGRITEAEQIEAELGASAPTPAPVAAGVPADAKNS